MEKKKVIESPKHENYTKLIFLGIGILLIIFVICPILMMIITTEWGFIPNYYNTKEILSNTINSAYPSGEERSGLLELKKTDTITIQDLASETNLDKESLIFTMGEFTSEDKIETDGTYLKYTGLQPKKGISAIVVCEQTNSDLVEYLSNSELDSKYDTSLASNGCVNDEIVCCVIIPTKRID